eukprot:CAMPEP_0194077118 /NCGR_PEP_ID=MMETSP0149-20130528/3787_1 /TAXON_ID=122233 /ORGANISM="Chaetoceros debilis, Strain MM31A-1" /LENGTH=210 /DNA_ID=CAMNT_0038758039 /DNA_START=27 /DNA_END=659 /DNA_ORIENTATION=-
MSASTESAPNPQPPNYPKLTVIVTVLLAIGFGLAYGVLALDKSNKEIYDSKIQTLRDGDLQWIYLGLVLLGRTIALLNFAPAGYKNGLKGNIRSNPFFFETQDQDEKGKRTMVLYQEDGTNGMYNRSNRSVQHLIENSGAFFAMIGPVGFVFPKQTCALVGFFCAGRVMHQRGYSQRYGKHAMGFVLSAFSIATMEGLALIAFLKAQELL